MKKIIVFVSLLMLISCSSLNRITGNVANIFTVSDNKEEQKFKEKLRSYSLEAKIITSKGDINIYLYPESAPETVANFVYLSKKNFYDDMPFHRVVANTLIQSGDSKGDSTGTAGYYIKDEFDSWVLFDTAGVIAVANTKESNTASSQFFITLTPNIKYNGKYTAFGNVISKQDLNIAKTIKAGDIIYDIEIIGYNVNDFLNNFKDQVKTWDSLYKK